MIEHASEIPTSTSRISTVDIKFLLTCFFFIKSSMYISYVNTGQLANKCHDASQNPFPNHPKSCTSN